MAIQTRQITGPIETPEHVLVTSGVLRITLLHPIAEEDVFVAPFKLNYDIVDGDVPASCQITVPGKYEFRIMDTSENRIWSFQICVTFGSGAPISIAQLWLLSRLEDGECECAQNCDTLDAATLGSDGADEGLVLTATGDGGTEWRPISGDGLGDMLKAIYDTNDDGCVDCADYASESALAQNSIRLGGLHSSEYQLAIQDAINEGAILTWDDTLEEYTPNENFLVGPGGEITIGDITINGAFYANTNAINQVYYEIDDEMYIIVTIEDDAELVLPDPVLEDRREINIKKVSTNPYDVLLTVAGGGNIEGGSSYTLKHQYDAITCVAIDGEWYIY
jgi:hypothetical protein